MKLLEKLVNMSLSNERDYEPNVFSREFKLRVKRFRDKRSDKIFNNVFPYLMPQNYGRRVLGMFDPFADEITNDILQGDDGYNFEDTYRHEQGHATKGRGEFGAVNYATNNFEFAEEHTGVQVPLFAYGPGSEQLPVLIEQPEIFTIAGHYLRLLP